MIPKGTTFAFLGRSGSGKDTQIKFLMAREDFAGALETNTGDILRAMAGKGTILGRKVKEVLDAGQLMPGWLSFYAWLSYFLEKIDRDEVLVSSGSPRRIEEAQLEDRALEFLGRQKPIGVHILISPEEARKRLLARARYDDTDESISNRLGWFETDVLPIIEHYRAEGRLIEINGEQTPEAVFAELEKKLAEHFQ